MNSQRRKRHARKTKSEIPRYVVKQSRHTVAATIVACVPCPLSTSPRTPGLRYCEGLKRNVISAFLFVGKMYSLRRQWTCVVFGSRLAPLYRGVFWFLVFCGTFLRGRGRRGASRTYSVLQSPPYMLPLMSYIGLRSLLYYDILSWKGS